MIAALIPAAGSSSRLGQPKLLVEFAGQTVIGRLVRSLRGGGAERVVVIAPPFDAAEGPAVAAEARLAGAEVVVPLTRPTSMRDSIALGLDRLARDDPPHSLVLTPGDYPGITLEIVAELVGYATKAPDRIVVPIHNGRRGHPIVLPWSIAAQINSLPPGVGVNVLVAEYRESVIEREVSHPEVITDLDTPDDLQHWVRRQYSGGRSEEFGFQVRVRFFALAKDRAGRSELVIELVHGSKVADLRAALGQRLPTLAPLLSTAMIAVDEEYASDDTPISPGSRLAVIPPVSGGAGDQPIMNGPGHFRGGGLLPR